MNEVCACTLSGPDLADRIQEWAAVTARATSRDLEGNRIVSTYPVDDDVVTELRRLIAAEAECCSFMTFRVDETRGGIRVELEVPQGMSDVLPAMLGLVAVTDDQGATGT